MMRFDACKAQRNSHHTKHTKRSTSPPLSLSLPLSLPSLHPLATLSPLSSPLSSPLHLSLYLSLYPLSTLSSPSLHLSLRLSSPSLHPLSGWQHLGRCWLLLRCLLSLLLFLVHSALLQRAHQTTGLLDSQPHSVSCSTSGRAHSLWLTTAHSASQTSAMTATGPAHIGRGPLTRRRSRRGQASSAWRRTRRRSLQATDLPLSPSPSRTRSRGMTLVLSQAGVSLSVQTLGTLFFQQPPPQQQQQQQPQQQPQQQQQ